MRRTNWPLPAGLALSILAFLTYFMVFARWPLTRDVPWATLMLFVAAVGLLVTGIRRARRKVVASIVAAIGIGIAAFFIYAVTVRSKAIPAAGGAPAVGERAPDFTLPDYAGGRVTLSDVLATPGTRGVLLIFYRGHW